MIPYYTYRFTVQYCIRESQNLQQKNCSLNKLIAPVCSKFNVYCHGIQSFSHYIIYTQLEKSPTDLYKRIAFCKCNISLVTGARARGEKQKLRETFLTLNESILSPKRSTSRTSQPTACLGSTAAWRWRLLNSRSPRLFLYS